MSTRIRVKQSEKAQGQVRREPQQQRSRATRDVILDAAVAVLKMQGPSTMNTNRVAEKAGVSIGSLYQYFKDKQAIYSALHERHVTAANQLIAVVRTIQSQHSLEQSIHLLIEGLVDLHVTDLELYRFLLNETPHHQLDVNHHSAPEELREELLEDLLKGVLAQHLSPAELATKSLVATTMISALTHSLILNRSSNLTVAQLIREIKQAVMGYIGYEHETYKP